ncbi:polyphosphoinositide phosphatase isoform X2 [Daktulosphaira vitifoliae]|uniref:polyphosphoinositide phosphatase isoform X2 n=1 Tax=Daktulosphaira vitifoliae TaxID=58002 RepID=UPI0021AA5B85|nr:polyphosphoinositide phosphatase isoform X2 [Daktulosphaira vitifoliae]
MKELNDNRQANIKFISARNLVQKIGVYESKNRYFVVGSNNARTKFRVLKIDRTEGHDLTIVDDQVEYSEHDMISVLSLGVHRNTGLNKIASAFGIVGFVKLLEGYYMILITKRRRVAVIGQEIIYKIEDTSMIYIPNDAYRIPNINEPRYLKIFQSVDLSSNFYFSYSYDVTQTLQVNLAVAQNIPKNSNGDLLYITRSNSNKIFVWNDYLLKNVRDKLHPDWVLNIMHGFISQSNVSIFGRPIYITLIARRSNRYAGTRFLKRGANNKGEVGNEVETEQIVQDVGVSCQNHLYISSFLQMRGSVPGLWSQDMTKMVPKPTILFELPDPFHEISGRHFNNIYQRYGSPTVIINLVKKREKKVHESQLSEHLTSAVKYLNQFLPPSYHIQYISFDMSRMNKSKNVNVMRRLDDIARMAINKTGIIRVNCVDCLDRTNTAQFALGKCALAYQLYYLGLLETPSLEYDTDCVRLLEVSYEDHGDTLALQYGGSQLIHRIKTYRKTAPWTSQGNDIMQTLSRYYSNTFSDTEKQNAINLFLGLFIPNENQPHIWEQNYDYYLHHPETISYSSNSCVPLTQWWDDDVLDCLPLSYAEHKKQYNHICPSNALKADDFDSFAYFYRTDEFSVMSESYTFEISHSVRDFMPNCVTDFSPFSIRIRPGKKREQISDKTKNPSMTGSSSTNSINSSSSCGTSESDDDTNYSKRTESLNIVSKDNSITFDIQAEQIISYGINLCTIKPNDIATYKKYVLMASDPSTIISVTQSVQPRYDSSFSVSLSDVSSSNMYLYESYVRNGLQGAHQCNDNAILEYKKYIVNI